MGVSKRKTKNSAPARTLEAEEDRLIALANQVAEKQMRDGTVTSQVLVHYLRLGTVRAQLEAEKLKNENELLRAKRENLESAANVEELYEKAIKAMRSYSGLRDEEGAEDVEE